MIRPPHDLLVHPGHNISGDGTVTYCPPGCPANYDCPECVAGKHTNCDGSTLNPWADDIDRCPCEAAGHPARL